MNIQREEGYSRPEKHCEPIQHNENVYSFHLTESKNSIQFSIDCKVGDTGTYPGT